jgi:hypothetical protein
MKEGNQVGRKGERREGREEGRQGGIRDALWLGKDGREGRKKESEGRTWLFTLTRSMASWRSSPPNTMLLDCCRRNTPGAGDTVPDFPPPLFRFISGGNLYAPSPPILYGAHHQHARLGGPATPPPPPPSSFPAGGPPRITSILHSFLCWGECALLVIVGVYSWYFRTARRGWVGGLYLPKFWSCPKRAPSSLGWEEG